MDLIEAVTRTRLLTAEIVMASISGANGKSEAEWAAALQASLAAHTELYPTGWYDPPPNGISVLIGKERMGFDSIRKPEFWPRTDIRYSVEIPVIVYVSPVDRASGMFGDFGHTFYEGKDETLRSHFTRGSEAILAIAELSRVGMKFSELHEAAMRTIAEHGFEHAHITTVTPQAGDSNFGHTVPWSDADAAPSSVTFVDLKEQIRLARRFINPEEHYRIPETCAFTVESRLLDPKKPQLPNMFFHVIVTFSKGAKRVLSI
ncbi:MAG: hypothetical protein JO019_03990 [Candidatus Kaiserbacteria bacterium]|nr:hypothetical protein [Candidatus Kaiserbacteria bacterium]